MYLDRDDDEIEAYSAVEIHDVLLELQAERALAMMTPLREVRPYMDDLEHELEAVDYLFVLTAVTELASARAELDGMHLG